MAQAAPLRPPLRLAPLRPLTFCGVRPLVDSRPIAFRSAAADRLFYIQLSVFTTRSTWGSINPDGPKREAASNREEDDVIASKRAPDRGAAVRRRTDGRRAGAGAGAGQDLRTETVALGAAVASAAEGHRGLGLLDREGHQRHHQVQGVPGTAARQGLRPLRYGARR